MDADQQLRNLRDFLLVYNRMTEICFQRCTSNFNYRNLTMDEERCVDSCAGKLIRSNHRLMGTYVHLMPRMVQRRMEEMESKAAENAKAAEAAASASKESPATDASSPPPPQTPALLPSLGTDAGPEAHGSVLKPAGLEMPVEFDVSASKFTTATEKLSAATPLTPATEAVSPSVLSKAGNGPFSTAGFSQPPIAGVQTEPGGSVPVLIPSKPTSLLEDVPVSTVAAPTVSKSTESLPGRERAPEVPPPSGQ
ncbi:mitochondrial import inner membrane translocase subunit Tim10 B [Toxotes jaculatrix]|uniref:mitochondrial import inner membrane translocase subunit Tim10 B n=1 Tax=Toxotes jaculatrix TaxID=941984 RepID=UPI001B3AB2EF|nr:mitochondrial import inner membrane translocase subunit Tim10 B [Toxotes jaculatrix]